MRIRLAIGIGFLVVVLFLIFAVQNSEIVAVNFLTVQFEASLALALFTTFLLGLLVGVLIALPFFSKKSEER